MLKTMYTGADFFMDLTLDVGGYIEDLTGATIVARIVDIIRENELLAPVAQLPGTDGADWAAGIVVVALDDTDTASITYQGRSYLQIMVTTAAGAVRPYEIPITIWRAS